MQITDEGRNKVLRRLKKILALTQSSNPGEAAAAMQQANTLMQRYGFSSMDAEVSDVQEVSCDLSGSEIKKWESALVGVVAKSMGVLVMTSFHQPQKGIRRSRASIVFVGENSRSQVAAYAFEALRKKLRQATKNSLEEVLVKAAKKTQPNISQEGIASFLKRMKLTPKQRDAYAFAWCAAVDEKVRALAPDVAPCVALYLESKVVPRSEDEAKAKPSRKTKSDPLADYLFSQGIKDGRGVDLFQGVNQAEAAPQIEFEHEHMRA